MVVYRDTVIAATGCSPAQLMLASHIRTTLPTLPTALRPRWPNPDLICIRRILTPKLSYRRNYDPHRGERPLPPVSPGDTVRVRTDNEKSWTIRADMPRSYTESGVYRRNTPESCRCHQTSCPVFLSVSLN